MMSRLLVPVLSALLLLTVGCASRRAWTVPSDLSRGDASQTINDAAAAGSLPALLEAAQTQLFDRDEERFGEFLRAALASGKLSDDDAATARWMLHDIIEVNSPGTAAADFRFGTPDKSENTLHTYLPGKPLAVIFYDPDCEHCKEVIAELSGLGSLIDVLAVCIEATQKRWEQTRDALPADWVKAYDRTGVIANDVYPIRVLPSLFLLDGGRKVTLKNPSPAKLIESCRQLSQ